MCPHVMVTDTRQFVLEAVVVSEEGIVVFMELSTRSPLTFSEHLHHNK